MTQDSGDEKTSAESEKVAGSAGKYDRQSVVGGVVSSFKYLQDTNSDAGIIKMRGTDRITWALLLVAFGLIVVARFVERGHLFTIMADILMAVVLFAFLGVRFGILRSLSARQAALSWQLIVGSFLLGLYCAFNIRVLALLQQGQLFK